VDHHHDVRASSESFAITGLLVTPIAIIPIVREDLQPQVLRDAHGLVGAVVIDKDRDVYGIREFTHSFFKGSRRIVSRHYDRDPFSVNHFDASAPEVSTGYTRYNQPAGI
jgi:hypothetical protein